MMSESHFHDYNNVQTYTYMSLTHMYDIVHIVFYIIPTETSVSYNHNLTMIHHTQHDLSRMHFSYEYNNMRLHISKYSFIHISGE